MGVIDLLLIYVNKLNDTRIVTEMHPTYTVS